MTTTEHDTTMALADEAADNLNAAVYRLHVALDGYVHRPTPYEAPTLPDDATLARWHEHDRETQALIDEIALDTRHLRRFFRWCDRHPVAGFLICGPGVALTVIGVAVLWIVIS